MVFWYCGWHTRRLTVQSNAIFYLNLCSAQRLGELSHRCMIALPCAVRGQQVSLILVRIKLLWFSTKKVSLPFSRKKRMELVLQISDIPSLIFGNNEITSIFAEKKFFLQFSPKYRDVLCAVIRSLILITSIFAKRWDSLAFSKMMAKKVAKIG